MMMQSEFIDETEFFYDAKRVLMMMQSEFVDENEFVDDTKRVLMMQRLVRVLCPSKIPPFSSHTITSPVCRCQKFSAASGTKDQYTVYAICMRLLREEVEMRMTFLTTSQPFRDRMKGKFHVENAY